jgi:sigma-B regulation protein RsbU (phosphoserine phosphatase)
MFESGADGFPLGLMPDGQYAPSEEFALDPGDSVLLVTDGLFEWTNASGEAYGLDRLRDSIRRVASLDAETIIKTLYAEACEFAGGKEQEDDVTIVVVRRR